VDIKEEKVFAQLGPRADREPDRWVLDSGAKNHMTGARGAFAELDRGIHGTVRFGDSFVVEIEGRGTVIFNCKNGEDSALTGVYYIPRLTADIISLGQLEEAGCRIIMDADVLKIFELGRKLLARLVRSPTRLYLLKLDIGHSMCLSARSTEAAWRWHARYGHLGFQSLRRLAHHDMVRGLPPM
jgi:pantoate kinase